MAQAVEPPAERRGSPLPRAETLSFLASPDYVLETASGPSSQRQLFVHQDRALLVDDRGKHRLALEPMVHV